MASIQLSGLASGFDWKTFVDQLINAERAPETQWRTQQTTLQTKISALDSLKTKLTDLQTAADAINSDGAFNSRTAAVADTSSGWSASAAPGTDAGQYRFSVTQLATKTQRIGAADAGAALSATSDVSGVTLATMNVATPVTAGTFTVDGAQVTIALTDSLKDVFDKISTATGGAVTASYDPASDRVHLSSASEIVLGSANETSNFAGALKLFNNGTGDILPPSALGVVSVASAITQAHLKTAVTAVDGSGNGNFTINGVNISFNVNTDSVQTVLGRINASGAGVVASYDRNSDQFALTNKTTGDTGLSVSEAPGGLLEALGLNSTSTLARGKNAQFSIDGGPTITSASNTFDASVHGITGLSVTATSQTTQTVTVAGDTSGARSKIENFIAKFNAVQDFIDSATKTTTSSDGKVTTSTLTGDHDVSDLQHSLRAIVFNSVPGLNGSIQRLESIGIDFKSGTSDLAIKDSAKLDNALTNNADDVQTLFNSQPGGVVAQLDAFVTRVTGSTGMIATETGTFTKESKGIDTQVANLERRLTEEQARLTDEFVAMEKAESLLQQQMQALTNAFGGSGSSTGSTSKSA
jgi:flagellar hook-associated protein 2